MLDFAALVRKLASKGCGHIEVTRSGMATAARLGNAVLDAGRSAVMVVRDAEELALARGLLTLFSPDASAGDSPLVKPRWESRWVVMPQHPLGARNRDAWASRMAALFALGQDSW